MEWQDISTADDLDEDEEILVWFDGWFDVVTIAWHDENDNPVYYNGDVVVKPTHWMPLPKPPVSDQ